MTDQDYVRQWIAEEKLHLARAEARMDGEASGFWWGAFFGALIVAFLWSIGG